MQTANFDCTNYDLHMFIKREIERLNPRLINKLNTDRQAIAAIMMQIWDRVQVLDNGKIFNNSTELGKALTGEVVHLELPSSFFEITDLN